MIHPQPTAVLMLLWEARVGVPREDFEPQEFIRPEQLDASANRARVIRVLTAGENGGTELQLARKPFGRPRRGPLALRRNRRPRRPACGEQTPAQDAAPR